FVDFQRSCMTSPVSDLVYFLNSSASPQVLENNLDCLIEEYHRTLCDTLSNLGHKNLRPTLDMICSEFHKKGIYGVLVGISVRSVVLKDENHIPDFEGIVNKGNIYLSGAYKTAMKTMLPLYKKWGWLNV
ncbi:hypothetical protein L9F63_025953, partial [Diploptera punctata]